MPSSNPLWFGYYPGDRPMVKRPDQRFPTPPPVDMSDMGLNAALDEAINVAGKPAEMPNQLWEWITTDLKFQFNVAAAPYVQQGSDLYEFGAGEVSDVPGAYVQLNLADLSEDPKKTLTKFYEKSVNTLNPFRNLIEGEFWTDLDTARERSMWRALLDNRDPDTMPLGTRTSFKIVKDAFSSSGAPLKLEGVGVFEEAKLKMFDGTTTGAGLAFTKTSVMEKDVYKEVAGNIMGFVSGKKSAFSRSGAYSKMQASFIHAAAVELDQKISKSTTKGPINTTLLGGTAPFNALSARATALKNEDILAKGFSEFNKGVDKKGVADVQDFISKAGFRGTITVGEFQTKFTDLNAKITDLQTQIATLHTSLPTDQGTLFSASTKEMEGILKDTEAVCGRYTNLPTGVTAITHLSKAEIEGVMQDLTRITSRFSNGRYSGGAHDRYLQSVTRRYFDGPSSLLTNSSISPVMSDGYRSLNTIYHFQKRVYLQEDGRDILNSLSKGDFGKTYLYFRQIKDRVQMFTPAYWAKKVVDRTYALGLVYKEDTVPLHPIFNKSPLIRNHVFTERFSIPVSGGTLNVSGKFSGGKHLQHFHDAWQRAVEGNKLVGSEITGSLVYGKLNQSWDVLFNAINGDTLSVGSMGPGMKYILGSEDTMKGLVNGWGKFRDALKNSGIPFIFENGELKNSPENRALLDGLFKRIRDRKVSAAKLDPFVERFGALQIYASWLTRGQQYIFSGVGRFFDPVIQLRVALGKKLADLGAKIISKIGLKAGLAALGAATGGIATALAPIIEKLMQAIVSKVIDKTKDMLKAVLKGDIVGELNKMMDDAMKATEKAITCGCFVPLFLAFAVFIIMANIIVSISPQDRSKAPTSTASVGGAVITPPPGSTSTGKFFKDGCNKATTCGSFRNGCHGTNFYWGNDASACQWNIPTSSIYGSSGLRGTTAPGFFCSSPRSSPLINDYNSGPEYGYAADYSPSCVGETTVYAPGFDSITGWKVVSSFLSGNGYGVLLRSEGSSSTYTMLVIHLLNSGWVSNDTINVGQSFGVLFEHPNGRHVHIELKKGSTVLEPETVL